MSFFFDHYPYTNFHNVNLDWVLQAVKAWGAQVESLGRQFANMQELWEAFKDETNQMIEAEIQEFNDAYEIDKNQLELQYQQFKDYVTNYLNNLDYETEIREYLQEMVNNGELTTLLAPTIASSVSDWLNNNITPTTPVIDGSLTVSGAGADARTVGTLLNLEDNYVNNIINNVPFANDIIANNQPSKPDINLTWLDMNHFTVNGTATTTFCNILGNTTSVPSAITKGRTYYFTLESTNPVIYPSIWVKHNDDTSESFYLVNELNKKVVSYTVKQDDKALIFRFGITPNTTVNASCSIFITSEYYSPYVNENLSNIESEITRRLNKFGLCIFEKGVYTLQNSITMPDDSKIMGFGNSSKILFTGSGSCFVMGNQSHIEELFIEGASNDITPPTYENIENRHGIEWSGDIKQYGVVNNCIIQRFSGSGIYALNTMTPTDHNLTVSNCQIRNCCVGVYIRKDSEFLKITNCTITRNTIGILNRGGNNIIANCGIDSNVTNILIDDAEGGNGGHGAITNCSLNHADSNNGYGLIISGTGRMIVSNCNLYYSKLKLVNTKGNVINSCGFGNNGVIEADEQGNNRCDIVTNCMFLAYTNAVQKYSGNIKVINCFTREGQTITVTDMTT